MRKNVVLIEWTKWDGMAYEIFQGLCELEVNVTKQSSEEIIPKGTDLVITYGPNGSLFPIFNQLRHRPRGERPLYVHWDTEGMPDFRLPNVVIQSVSALRSRLGEVADNIEAIKRNKKLSQLFGRMARYRNFGDYHRAYRSGWLDRLFEYSLIYAQAHNRNGLPAVYIPWGTAKSDYSVLQLERDIDVVWLGKKRSKRRSNLIDEIRASLEKRGYKMLIFDGVENPYIFGDERTKLLNRTKITLNLLPHWDFNNFPFKFHLAAGNRSMVVSENLLPHIPEYKPGFHYIEAAPEQITDTIINYLQNEKQRADIAENAFSLATVEMTMTNSTRKIMESIYNSDIAIQ